MVGIALGTAYRVRIAIYENTEVGYLITSNGVFWIELKITTEKD